MEHNNLPPQVKKYLEESKGKARVQKHIEIEYVPIMDLQPNDYNPNRQNEAEFEALCKSIIDDGCTVPIVVDKDTLTIVDGEHRWRACAVLGYNEIPVVKVEFTERQKRMATLRYNKARGTEDLKLLQNVIKQIDAQ